MWGGAKRRVGWGGESRDRNDYETRESGVGKVEERKVGFAAQCQDPKNNSPVFLLLSECVWGRAGFFLSRQMVDGACLAAATSLALLQKGFLCTGVGNTRRGTNGMLVRLM